MNKYDLIIVGMGPGGIFCAYELIKLNKHKNILLIDQGKEIRARNCPIEKAGKCLKCKPYCNITCGFSGAGAFSDGKLNSYHMSNTGNPGELYLGGNGGGYISKYYNPNDIKALLKYTDDVYLDFGADKKLHGTEYIKEIEELQAKARKENMQLVYFPIRHLGTEKAHILYTKLQDYLTEHKVNMMFNTEVVDIITKDNQAIGVKVKKNGSKTEEQIFADNVVLSVGRKGASWLSDLCHRHNVNTKTGPVDIGVRFELPNAVMEKINKYLYEGKFVSTPQPFCDKVRTFCQNPSGFVSAEVYDNNLTLVNGHSYKDRKSNNTNLAILVSHNFTYPFDKPIQYGVNVAENLNQLVNGSVIVQRLGDIYRGKRTWEHELKTNKVQPTLTSAVAGDITYALGYRTTTNILQFIRSMDRIVEGFANPENLLYAPEIKFYSNELVLDQNFETNIKNLHSIGDGGGLTTGLMMASASGVQMARILDRKIK